MSDCHPHPARPLSVLVVDDEEHIRDVLGTLLEEAGHIVSLASGAPEALERLAAHGPVDIVLSDINMPGMDGLELARRIRRDWPGMPVLLISGRPRPEGAPLFIPKPFRWETLASAIQSAAKHATATQWAGARGG